MEDGCTHFRNNNGRCAQGWYGMQPAVFQESNHAIVDLNGEQSTRLSMGTSSDLGVFEIANNLTDDECGCEYHTWTSGVLKSYKT